MPPAKPLPMLVPVTSTYWPGTKCAAVISAPTAHQRVLGDAELGELRLRLDFRGGEVAALRLGHVLDLGGADPELQRGVAVLLLRALRDDLAIVDAQHRHRDVVALVGEDPAHAELLRDQTGSHRRHPTA